MKWKRWKVQAFDRGGEREQTDCVVIEAPSPEVAIEYFLATHGMLTYELIRCGETDQEPDEGKVEVRRLLTAGLRGDKRLGELVRELAGWHRWEDWGRV